VTSRFTKIFHNRVCGRMGAATGKTVDIGARRLEITQRTDDKFGAQLFLVKDVRTGEIFSIKRSTCDQGDVLKNAMNEWETHIFV